MNSKKRDLLDLSPKSLKCTFFLTIIFVVDDVDDTIPFLRFVFVVVVVVVVELPLE